MRNNFIVKFIFILIMTVCIFSLITPKAYALGEIMSSADNFVNIGANGDQKINTHSIKNMSDLLYNVLLMLGIVIAVIWGLFIAVQFITGSAEAKAEVKKTLVPYVAGCAVLFGAFTIWKIVLTILQG